MVDLDLTERLLSEGKIVDRVDLLHRRNAGQSLELARPALTIAQSVFEEELMKAIRNEDVDIRSPCEATSLTRSANSVQARVVRRECRTLGAPPHDGEWEPVESSLIDANFVIGADGYESRVRASLGFESLDLGATETFASAAPDLDRLRALLAERAPWHEQQPTEVQWSTVTHLERRLARRFGSGRVWLASDAAHVTSPFGGQSLNGGLNEANALVEHMADCILSAKPLAALEQLAAVRER